MYFCQTTTEKFIRDQLGVPVYLKPDYEDLSCEMCFGVPPPDLADDPAVRQSCLLALEAMALGAGGGEEGTSPGCATASGPCEGCAAAPTEQLCPQLAPLLGLPPGTPLDEAATGGPRADTPP